MIEVPFYSPHPLRSDTKAVLRAALDEVYGAGVPVKMVFSQPGPRVICFGSVEGPAITVPDQKTLLTYPNARGYLVSALLRHEQAAPLVPGGYDPDSVLYLDIETHNAGREWDMPLREFFRLGQYAWGPEGEVHLTTDLDEVLDAIASAELVIAHNGHAFDFSVLLDDDALHAAADRRLFDTMVFANLALPAPDLFYDREGKKVLTSRDGKTVMGAVKKWLSLDNLCFQLGTPGKIGNLQALAKKYNPKGTRVADLDYGLIPLDDPEFVEYAKQDIVALQLMTTELLRIAPVSEYDWREQMYFAINAQMTRNGFLVDTEAAQARVEELAKQKADLLARLEAEYDFPTEGKSPWASAAGKAATFKILADHGITPETKPDWKRTATGALSLSGDVLIELTKGTEVESLGEQLAALKGQRSLAEQALMYCHSDSRVHPEMSALQRSGRCSTTNPALTTWSAKGPKAIEKRYFIASPMRKLMEFDLSNADQRILAAISGDKEYAKRFDEGVDGHEINGRIMFGDEVYDSDPEFYRNASKAPGHAWSYGAGTKKLAWTTKLPLETMERFVAGMAEKYPVLTDWQMKVRKDAERDGFTTNRWGRRMVINPERAWTMTPALQGQSGTSEVMKDALIRMYDRDPELIYMLVGTVHDALIADIPEVCLTKAVQNIIECTEVTIGGVDFPLAQGKPADNWWKAGH